MSVYDEIREKLPLKTVASRYVKLIPVNSIGTKYKGLCPFHNEDTPSFYLDNELGVFHCFGCKAGGTVIDFLMKKEGLSLPEVPKYVQQQFDIELTQSRTQSTQYTTKKSKQLEVLKLFIERFATEANKGHAFQYLRRRIPRLTEEIVGTYGIFFVPDDKATRNFLHTIDKSLLSEAAELGVVYSNKKPYFTPFVGRVIFPIRHYNITVGFNGRTITDKSPKYLLTKKGLVFKKTETLWGYKEAINIANKKDKKYVFVVEGVVDALALAATGEPAVASLGSSLSVQQLNLAFNYFQSIILIPDGDKAGKVGAFNTIQNALSMSMSGSVISMPKGVDVADFLKSNTLDDLLELPTRSFEDYFIDFHIYLAKKATPNKSKEIIKSAFLSMILPKLLDFKTNTLSAAILMRIAERLALDPYLLQLRINQGLGEAKTVIKRGLLNNKGIKNSSIRLSSSELQLLAAIRIEPQLFKALSEKPWYSELNIIFRDIAESFYEQYLGKGDFLSRLENKLQALDDEGKEAYYGVLSLIPFIPNKNTAYSIFNRTLQLFDVIKSKENEALKILKLSKTVRDFTKPFDDDKEKRREVKKSITRSKKSGEQAPIDNLLRKFSKHNVL